MSDLLNRLPAQGTADRGGVQAQAPSLSQVSGGMIAVARPAVSWQAQTAIPRWLQAGAELELDSDGTVETVHIAGRDCVGIVLAIHAVASPPAGVVARAGSR